MTARWLALVCVVVVGCGPVDRAAAILLGSPKPTVHDVCVESVVVDSKVSINGGPWHSEGYQFAGQPGECMPWLVVGNTIRVAATRSVCDYGDTACAHPPCLSDCGRRFGE